MSRPVVFEVVTRDGDAPCARMFAEPAPGFDPIHEFKLSAPRAGPSATALVADMLKHADEHGGNRFRFDSGVVTGGTYRATLGGSRFTVEGV